MPFDADKFLNSTTQGAMATVVLVCPEGEYRAFVDDGDKAIQVRSFKGKDGKPDSHQVQVLWAITGDQPPNQFLKREKVLVPQTVWLDVDENGDLDMSEGKNVGLGRLRRALNQNEASQAWNPLMMKGKGPCLIKTGQRADEKDPTIKYAEVTRVATITT